MARSRSRFSSAARSSTRTMTGVLQVSQIPWEKEAEFPAAGSGLERDDGSVLPQYRLAVPAPGCLRSLYQFKSAAESRPGSRRSNPSRRKQAKARIHEPGTRRPDRQRRPLRGIPPLSLSALGEKPPALDVRRPVPARSYSERTRRHRRLVSSDGMPRSGGGSRNHLGAASGSSSSSSAGDLRVEQCPEGASAPWLPRPLTWQEAVEREIELGERTLAELCQANARRKFMFASSVAAGNQRAATRG